MSAQHYDTTGSSNNFNSQFVLNIPLREMTPFLQLGYCLSTLVFPKFVARFAFVMESDKTFKKYVPRLRKDNAISAEIVAIYIKVTPSIFHVPKYESLGYQLSVRDRENDW
jgi:hypothetical protein